MFHTSPSSATHSEPVQDILERAALPLLLFAAVLLVLLFLSWFSILPRFTRFAVANTTLSPTEMAAYVTQQQSSLATLEQKRNRLVLPEQDPGYTALKTEKRTMVNALDVQTLLLQVAGDLHEGPNAITLSHLDYDASTSVVSVSGDVRDVGLRSMTVLASYTESLETMPFVQHLIRPAFTREQNADGTFHSPFTLSFTYHAPHP